MIIFLKKHALDTAGVNVQSVMQPVPSALDAVLAPHGIWLVAPAVLV